jgi:hypothetical protein
MEDYKPKMVIPDNCLLIRMKKDGKDVFHRFLKLEQVGIAEKTVFDMYLKVLEQEFNSHFQKQESK